MPACVARPPVIRVMLMSAGNSRGAPLNGRPAHGLTLSSKLSQGIPLRFLECFLGCFDRIDNCVCLQAFSGIAHPSHPTVLVAS
jgi:hypothetical protein